MYVFLTNNGFYKHGSVRVKILVLHLVNGYLY